MCSSDLSGESGAFFGCTDGGQVGLRRDPGHAVRQAAGDLNDQNHPVVIGEPEAQCCNAIQQRADDERLSRPHAVSHGASRHREEHPQDGARADNDANDLDRCSQLICSERDEKSHHREKVDGKAASQEVEEELACAESPDMWFRL